MPKMLGQQRKINTNRCCRTCLSERGHLRQIFSTKMPKMLQYCASIQISKCDDNMPTHVCSTCFYLICKLYAFKKKMEKTDQVLRKYIEKNKNEVKIVKQQKKDILNIAINEAQIDQTNTDDDSSDDDMPLSERQKKLRLKSVTTNNFDEQSTNDFTNTTILPQIEPPPLVPLAPTASKPTNYAIIKNLPADPPPLVPLIIKPVPLAIIPGDADGGIVPPETLSCTNCNQTFESIDELNTHKSTTGSNSCCHTLLKCNICRKEFKDRKRLIGHLKGHMVVKEYGCKICGKRYPNPSTFRVHMRTHTGERPFECPICNKGFVRWAGVVGHMKTHQPQKPYKCGTCGKAFKISSNLERHKVLHADSLPFCCNYCGKTFSQSDNLQLHIRTYHTNERPYLCNECGKGFVSSARLNRHMWVHTGYKPYSCPTCSKAYSNSNDLKNHERSHTDTNKGGKVDIKPYGCLSCGMRFYHQCRLARHMNTHARPFACTICFKTFSSKSLLNKHLTSKRTMHYANQVDVVEEEMLVDNEVEPNIEHIFVQYQ